MSTATPLIDPTLSVNEIIRRYPDAVRVLNAFGIDTCCGGTLPLASAAAEADVQLTDVADAIADTLALGAEQRARRREEAT